MSGLIRQSFTKFDIDVAADKIIGNFVLSVFKLDAYKGLYKGFENDLDCSKLR